MTFAEDFQLIVNATQQLKLTVPEHVSVQNALARLKSAAEGNTAPGYLPAPGNGIPVEAPNHGPLPATAPTAS